MLAAAGWLRDRAVRPDHPRGRLAADRAGAAAAGPAVLVGAVQPRAVRHRLEPVARRRTRSATRAVIVIIISTARRHWSDGHAGSREGLCIDPVCRTGTDHASVASIGVSGFASSSGVVPARLSSTRRRGTAARRAGRRPRPGRPVSCRGGLAPFRVARACHGVSSTGTGSGIAAGVARSPAVTGH